MVEDRISKSQTVTSPPGWTQRVVRPRESKSQVVVLDRLSELRTSRQSESKTLVVVKVSVGAPGRVENAVMTQVVGLPHASSVQAVLLTPGWVHVVRRPALSWS